MQQRTLFPNSDIPDHSKTVLWSGKSAFNGTVTCFEERGYRYIQSLYKARFPITQTTFKISNPLVSKFPLYPQGLTLGLPHLAHTPDKSRVLLIGGAGGYLLRYLEHYHPKMEALCVEIDSVMVDLAQKYFGIGDNMIVGDGAEFVNGYCGMKFDWVILDAFQGMYIPEPFKKEIFYENLVNRVLTSDGVLSLNTVREEELTPVLDNIKKYFPQQLQRRYFGGGNFISVFPLKDCDVDLRADILQKNYKYLYSLPEMNRRFLNNKKEEPSRGLF